MKHGDKVKQSILDAGLSVWAEKGRQAVTTRAIGKAVGLTHGAVLYHFGAASTMVDAVAEEAVRVGNSTVIRQLIATNHPAVNDMPGEQKAKFWCD